MPVGLVRGAFLPENFRRRALVLGVALARCEPTHLSGRRHSFDDDLTGFVLDEAHSTWCLDPEFLSKHLRNGRLAVGADL